MADLPALQRFAADHNFGLTAPLTHAQVTELATEWLPNIYFHWDERFFPITLDDMFDMVENPFATLQPPAQEAWRVGVRVRSGATAIVERFDPPVVRVPDGAAVTVTPSGDTQVVSVARVLNQTITGRAALHLPEVDDDAVITHGATFTRADQFFGPLRTLRDLSNASETDPYRPRADEPDPDNPGQRRSRITVMAAFMNLLELLKYELTALEVEAETGVDYPPDGLRGGFNITGSLLKRHMPNAPDFPAHAQRQFLLALIAAHETGAGFPTGLPPGWRLDEPAWNALTRFAFLEYDFFYAYNDWERYQTAIVDNEHEGDDEGCCLVFDRNVINLAASGAPGALLTAVPHSIITSVHEESQDADLFKPVPPPILQPNQPAPQGRDVVDFTVYIAGGSHATYLTKGNHDVADYQDTWSRLDVGWTVLLSPLIFPVSIILAILEHFIDTEDYTSDKGIHAGPQSIVGNDPAGIPTYVTVIPMSADNNIYLPQNEPLLALRAYAGKWGGDAGIIDYSSPFAAKTGRYFRKLLSKL